MKRKILSVLICLAVVLAAFFLLPTHASAETEGYYTYSVFNDEVTITDCSTFISGEITIPSTLGGYPVTTIGNKAFYDCSSLTSVTIPDSVTSIGSSAFQDCRSLTNIIIPHSVTSIGTSVFKHCSSLTDIVIPDSVTSIGESAFYYCGKLTSIIIPDSITSIGDSAFINCSSLTSITIPDGVTSIGNGVFSGCGSLTSITIPDSVTSIDSSAFYGCGSLTSITIPDSVTSIGDSAFKWCSSLTSITIPDSVTSIGAHAFSYCGSLASVTIGGSVTSIGWYAFAQCNCLIGIIIPVSVNSIGFSAFENCNNLTYVYYTGTQQQWDAVSIDSSNKNLLSANLTVNYRPGHTCEYGDWVVIVKPTFTSLGERSKVCTVCGDTVTETMDMLVGKVQQWNVVLQDVIAVNFYLQISESIENTAKVKLIVGNDTVTYNVSALEKTANGYYLLSANIFAAHMNELIIVMVMNGRDVGSTATYTVREYCDTILADEGHSQYHALVKKMLNYGAMAQVYFNYDTENLANDGITDTAAIEVPETAEEITVSDKISGLSFYGASLVYRDKIAVRYYFTGDVTGCTFTANGNTYTPVAKDGMHYVEIADIVPQDLDQQITVTVSNVEGNTLTVSYSPMNYIVRMNQKGSEAVKNLVKALYNYHLAAKALRTTV